MAGQDALEEEPSLAESHDIGNEVATLWGHFGAMRQKIRAPDVVPRW